MAIGHTRKWLKHVQTFLAIVRVLVQYGHETPLGYSLLLICCMS